jgi:hypothetical protein
MKKLFQTKKYFLPLILMLLVVGVFGVANISLAEGEMSFGSALWDGTKVALASPILIPLAGIFFLILAIVGTLDTLVIAGIGQIASYNNFINEASIITAWAIVRDLSNMFFILIFLVIAFATILRIESYQLKKLLPKLIIVAVLINFSKTICGLIIDFTQVIMLTFVGTWSGNGGGIVNLVLMQSFFSSTFANFGVSGQDFSVLNVIAAGFVGVIFMIFVGIVLVATLGVFLMRIVMLWIYIVLSPLAFILSAIPAGQKYASQWWGDFIKYAVSGPILAFFIWMAMVTVEGVKTLGTFKVESDSGFECAGVSDIMCLQNFLPFILSLAFLIGGLMITQKVGGVIGGIAGKALDYGKKGSIKALTGDNVFSRKMVKYGFGIDWRPVTLAKNLMTSLEDQKGKDEKIIREKGEAHFQAGAFRSVVLGQGAGEDYFNRYADGPLGLKGMGRAASELGYRWWKRGGIGKKIDNKEAENKKLEKEREGIMEKAQPEIDTAVEEAMKKSQEVQKNLQQQEQIGQEIALLKEKESNGSITDADEKKLEKLKEKQGGLKKKYKEMNEKAKELVMEGYYKTTGGERLGEIDVDLKANKNSLKELREEMYKVQKPVAFEARSHYRSNIEEAKKKYKSLTNSDELQKAYIDAEQRGDKHDMIALLEKLSADGNLNEELRAKGYGSDAKGLRGYIYNEENDFGQRKGLQGHFNEDEKIRILNDLGETEERVNNWEMAKMVGLNSKGELESLVKPIKDATGKIVGYDDTEHAAAAYAEIIKMDPQVIANKINRLGYGGEDGRGVFQISNLGKMLFKYMSNSGTYVKSAGRLIGNTAANLNSPEVMKVLRKIMTTDEEMMNLEKSKKIFDSKSEGNTILAGPTMSNLEKAGGIDRGKRHYEKN